MFAIPVDNEYCAYGQIVSDTKPKCYVIFDFIAKEHPAIEKIVRENITMLTFTVDVFVEDGDWPLIGHIEPNPKIKFPNYLIETLEGIEVMDYSEDIVRGASEEDKSFLGTKKSVTPKILDLAVKAKYGRGEWYPTMQILIYKPI